MIGELFNKIREKDRELHVQHEAHETVPFAVLLAIVGGFLDAYTFISRDGVFATAQTGNIVLLGVYASEGEWRRALLHIPPIIAFIIGVFVAEWIKNKSSHFVLGWERLVLIFEIIVLCSIGLIPHTIPNIVVTVAVSFASSVQVSSFRKLVDSPYNSTITTGNLRSASCAAYTAITQKDYKSAVRAIRYFIIILSFLLGGFLGGLLTVIIGSKAIWGAATILVFAVILFSIYERKNREKSV